MIHAPMSQQLYVGFSVTRSLAAEKDQSTGVCVWLERDGEGHGGV